MEWLKKLSAAIDYIENNLDGDISYDEAAEIACCPTFYLQRIFSYVAGVSLSEYIRQFAFPFKLQEETLCRIILLKTIHSEVWIAIKKDREDRICII